MKFGLTGGIACGKSSISKYLETLGFEIIDCDKIAHRVLEQEDIVETVRLTYGDKVIVDNKVSRPKLSEIVFTFPEALEELESIVVPEVYAKVTELLSVDRTQFVDSFRIIDTPLHDLMSETWAVTCKPEQQIARLTLRNGLTRQQASSRIKLQKDNYYKADFIIDNSGSLENAKAQINDRLRLRKYKYEL